MIAGDLDQPEPEDCCSVVGLSSGHRHDRWQGEVGHLAVNSELKRQHAPRSGGMKTDHEMALPKVARVTWPTMRLDVAGRGQRDLFQHSKAAGDHVADWRHSDPQHAIDALADQVNKAVALAHANFDTGIG